MQKGRQIIGMGIIIALSLIIPTTISAQGYSWNADLHHRLLLDFNKKESDVVEYIKRYIPNVSKSKMLEWEKTGALEFRLIDGEKRYFHNAAPNLFRIDKQCKVIKQNKDGKTMEGYEKIDMENVPKIIAKTKTEKRHLAEPKRIRVKYTITVKADAVPAGETIRCWLPFPRTDMARQLQVRLISTSENQYQKSPENCVHSSVYMEKQAVAGKPTVFSELFEYVSYGSWFNLQAKDIKPYDMTSQLYKKFTSERDRHIVFTPRLRHLADSITQGATNPLDKAKRIFKWINYNFPWASAREYSTIENIPEYVLENHHGDCGQVTLLFLTLCRISGIPAHFESGFMLHPNAENLHDWGEIYFEGIGWVPVDMSFGIPTYAKTDDEKWFFLGGIDSWRMAVNSDFSGELMPAKKWPRSETVDFQRGEVEWEGGNLYFDKWNWSIDEVSPNEIIRGNCLTE